MAVDMYSGKLVQFDEQVPEELKVQTVLSSASIPGAFQPQHIKGLILSDGGVFDNLNLAPAIEKCRE